MDLETTGLTKGQDQIIEIGAIRIENNICTGKWNSLVCPDFSILPEENLSPYVSSLTGITKEMLQNAPPLSELTENLLVFLDTLPICGHRVDFDISFLNTALEAHDYSPLTNDFFDTLLLSQKLLPELIHHKLGDLARYYHIDYQGAHRAFRDCEITLSCLNALKKTAELSFPSKEAFQKHWEFGNRHLSASDIIPQTTDFDRDHPLFEKNIAITGILFSLCRREAMQRIVNLGGRNQDKVNSFTDFLVHGESSGTTKEKKALRLAAEGCPIRILSEMEFLQVL
jgi:DNA polymerase-3 subunit epsilon